MRIQTRSSVEGVWGEEALNSLKCVQNMCIGSCTYGILGDNIYSSHFKAVCDTPFLQW